MSRYIAALFALAIPAFAGDVRTYSGNIAGVVAGQVVTATVEIEVEGTPAAGSECLARARLVSDPGPFPVSAKWSRWHKATIGGKPARFDVQASQLVGQLGVDWADDFSTITVQARGTASVFAVEAKESVLSLTKFAPATSNVVVKPNPILTRVYAKKKGVIGFEANVPSSWPRKTGSNGKTVNAITALNGKKFDFARVGQNEKGVENLYGSEYGQSIHTGDTVYFSLMDLNKKNETDRLPFVWPWEPTGR